MTLFYRVRGGDAHADMWLMSRKLVGDREWRVWFWSKGEDVEDE